MPAALITMDRLVVDGGLAALTDFRSGFDKIFDSVDVIVTSPPYNLGIQYNRYQEGQRVQLVMADDDLRDIRPVY